MAGRLNRKLLSLAVVLALSGIGCQSEKPETVMPSVERIRNIAQLSTIDAYFHNVQKATKAPGQGIAHWFEVERKYWITYSGVITYGIDFHDVKVEVRDQTYFITIPSAEVQDVRVDPASLNKDSIIASTDTGWNRNEITDQEQVQLMADAKKEMKLAGWQNRTLLSTAQNRAGDLIRNYIEALNQAAGTTCEISIQYAENKIPESVQKEIEDFQNQKQSEQSDKGS